MTILKNTKMLWLLLAILVGFSSCKKDKDAEPVGLEVKINDLSGVAQSGAKVALYSSEDDWKNEQNPVVSGQTGSDGTVRFNDVSGTFYVDVVNGSLNNWQGGAASTSVTATANTLTNTTVAVSESAIGFIASAAGKAWKLKAGHPLQTCNDDDVDTFYKSGLFKDDNGSDECGEKVALDTQGSWALSENDSKLTLSGLNYPSGGLTLDLVSVSATELVIAIIFQDGSRLELTLVPQ